MTRRRRLGTGFAALLMLTGTLVVAGATAANADGGLEFDPALDGANVTWTGSGFTFSGTTITGGDPEVSVYDDDGETQLCSAAVVGTTWSCTTATPLPLGPHSYTAFQSIPALPPALDVATLTVVPGPPSYDQANPYVVAQDSTALFSGDTSAPNASIQVTIDGITPFCAAGPIAVPGDWTCSLSLAGVTPGDYTMTVTQTAGGYLSSASGDLTIAPPVAFGIDQPLPDSWYEWDPANEFDVVGTVPDASQPVEVSVDGDAFCTAIISGTTWACDNQFYPEPGDHVLAAQRGADVPVVVDIVVLLPRPNVGGHDTEFPQGVASISFTGQTMYSSASTRATLYEGQGEGRSATPTSVTECDVVGADWICAVDGSALATGDYTVLFAHYLPSDPSVSSAESWAEFTVVASGTGATVRCEFSPAGLVATTTDPNVMLSYASVASGSGSPVETFGLCSGHAGLQPAAVSGYGPSIGCSPTCALTGLAPGLHSLWFMRSDGDETGGVGTDTPGFEPYQFFFRIPATPSVTSLTGTGPIVTATGAGVDGDEIRLVDQGGATLCTTTVTSGMWSCAFPRSTVTSARALAIDTVSGGLSAYSSPSALPAAAGPTTPPLTTPPPPAPPATPTIPTLPTTPAAVKLLVGFPDLMNLAPGDTFSVTISGVPEGWGLEVIMHSTPRSLGTAASTGAPMSMDLTVPEDIESGAHRIEVVATTPLGTNYYVNADANVRGGTVPVDEPPAAVPGEQTDDPAGGGAGEPGDRTDPGAPSALSGAIAPLSAIAAHPITLAIAGGLALALLLLVALPTELLNSSLSSNTSRLGRAYGAIDGALTKAQDWLIRVTRSRAIPAAVLVVLVAIIYGFVDPGFGLDVVSLRLVLSLAIAFFLLTFVASWVSGLIIRRLWGASGVVALQPSIILFALLGVVVARVLDFTPGFLVGIAIGLELVRASRQVAGRAVFVQLSVVTGFALAAWVVYSLFTPGDDFVGMLVDDTLVAVTAEGLTGAVIAIFPLRFLDGRDLWEVSKRLWVVAFLLVGTAFALLVLPTAIEGTEVADYGVWLAVFAVFGLVSLAAWFVFARAAKRDEAAENDAEARSTEKHSGTRR